MGELNVNDIPYIINNCSNRLLKYIDKVKSLNEESFIFMLIILTQLPYAKYYKAGRIKGNTCRIVPRDLCKVIEESKLVSDIILLRNLACHQYGSRLMKNQYSSVRTRDEDVNILLKKLLKQDDPLQSAINKMNGI